MEPEVLISNDKREDHRYHKLNCRWCDHIRHANKRQVTLSEARERGYKRCDECKPQ
jgi:hypothetical protein